MLDPDASATPSAPIETAMMISRRLGVSSRLKTLCQNVLAIQDRGHGPSANYADPNSVGKFVMWASNTSSTAPTVTPRGHISGQTLESRTRIIVQHRHEAVRCPRGRDGADFRASNSPLGELRSFASPLLHDDALSGAKNRHTSASGCLGVA